MNTSPFAGKQYTLGFAFGRANRPWKGECVALIEKAPGTPNAGKLNGLGGRIEPNESTHECMVREFQEEAGLLVPEWDFFGDMTSSKDWKVFLYRALDVDLSQIRTMTEEHVTIWPLTDLPLFRMAAHATALILLARSPSLADVRLHWRADT